MFQELLRNEERTEEESRTACSYFVVQKTKAKVAGYIFLIDLFDLPGNKKLLSKGYKTFSLIKFPGH